mgnify:CR=1 FL=1
MIELHDKLGELRWRRIHTEKLSELTARRLEAVLLSESVAQIDVEMRRLQIQIDRFSRAEDQLAERIAADRAQAEELARQQQISSAFGL